MGATYVKVQFAIAGVAYQEIVNGGVTRYVDVNGVTLFSSPPVGDSCSIVDASADELAQVAAAALATEPPYNVETMGERRKAKRRNSDQ